jgi:serine protease Do
MAKFIGGDQKSDLAVIKIDKKKLPKAKLGDSDTLEVGELAVAIGNPLGLEFQGSVTVGVISALNRTISIDDRTMNLIQTDAAINPGNSGGALLNSKGEVIGINTIKISISGVEGLGFAIPVNEAKPIVDQLIMFGYVKGRPYIGISGREITETLSYLYDIPVGIYILDVVKDSGAEKAGIRKGDTLVSLDGVDVRTMKEVDTIKDKYKAGDTVSAVVVRNGKKIKLSLTFTEDK